MSERHDTAAQGGMLSKQLDMFADLLSAYVEAGGSVSNEQLYQRMAKEAGTSAQEWGAREPIGESGALHSPAKRALRWRQQTARRLELLERVPGERGRWRLTKRAKDALTPATPKMIMLGFSTDLGLALWASSADVFVKLDEPVHLILTSPPYPLAQPRAYGNPDERKYVEWLVETLEPVIKLLVPGGSLTLNVSNDVFLPGSPARSTYLERLVLALCDRGLSLVDRLVWRNEAKPPGPIAWASKKRFQLNVAWEPVLWFTNCPEMLRADNRRVLQPHSERHQELINRGGEKRHADYSDGAYKVRPGSFGHPTAGKIPRNVLSYGHHCSDLRKCRAEATKLGLKHHGAPMPLRLARFLVEWLTEEGDLVVDNMAGWLSTAKAAEELGRRWIAVERMAEYVIGSSTRFRGSPGFEPGPLLEDFLSGATT